MFAELRNDYYDPDEKCYCIDGWRTSNNNEEGIVIARVYKDKVTYKRPNYATLNQVIEIVEETKKLFKNN